MRTRVYSILLALSISLSAPQPVMAQDIVEDAAKIVGGLISVFGKKKKAKQADTQPEKPSVKTSATVSQNTQAAKPVQEGIKKEVWVDALYPGGGWLLPMDEEKGIIQVRIHVNRWNVPMTASDYFKGWGEINIEYINIDDEGQLGAPTQIGDVYYFDITTKSGSSRIGIKKIRKISEDNPNLKIVEITGALSKWIKPGSELIMSQANGRGYDPTLHAMTETELDSILKLCNNGNFANYNWWVRNRKSTSTTTASNATKSSGQLYLLGIPVKQPKAKLDAALKSKGFVKKQDEYGNEELLGTIDGTAVRIVTADKCLTMTDKKLYSLVNAKKRFSALLTKMTSEYGRGKYTSEEEYSKAYQIDGPGGTIEISMWDSDEVDFTSGQYLVSVTYNAACAK